MKILARVKKIFEIEQGSTKAGKDWKKQRVLVTQLNNDFRDELIIEFFNDWIPKGAYELNVGQPYEFEITIKSREWNGKYYTNVTGSHSILPTESTESNTNNDETPF